MLHATGNLTRDAEVKELQNGLAITFTLAEDRRTAKEGNQTVFIGCTLWNREKIAPYLTKGTLVEIVGDVTAEAYKDKAYLKVANVLHIKILGGGQKNQAAPDARRNAQRAGTPVRGNRTSSRPVVDEEPDDDNPF